MPMMILFFIFIRMLVLTFNNDSANAFQLHRSTPSFSSSLIKKRSFSNTYLQQAKNDDTTTTTTTTTPTTSISSERIAEAASKFKVVTCTSTSCCKKRKALGLDSLATFAAMYERSKSDSDNNNNNNSSSSSSSSSEESNNSNETIPSMTIAVEEGPCMGSCQLAPCVAVEHEDFVGYVSLEGMSEREFTDRVFHNIITEEDADRVWSSITNAVQVMAEEEA